MQAWNENERILDALSKEQFTGVMIHHTMIVAFDNPIPASELDRYLTELEELVLGSGLVDSYSARQHIRVPVTITPRWRLPVPSCGCAWPISTP